MVRRFYSDVAQDDVLGPMFNDVAKVDWSEHLPKLTAFWCRLLFGLPGYGGSALKAHQLIHAKRAFTPQHFERWLELFHDSVDLGWTGANAEKVKAFAIKVARVHAQYLDRTESAGEGVPAAEHLNGASRPVCCISDNPVACSTKNVYYV